MTKYVIEINYTTGNSFGSQEETDHVGWVFDTMESAKLALSYIRQHHQYMKELDSFEGRMKGGRQAIKDKYKGQPWFCPEYSEVRILFEDRSFSTFWIGYFETLHKAMIVPEPLDEDEDNELVFRPRNF